MKKKKSFKRFNNFKGFTLIEIIGAIVILGIIAIIAFATYTNSLKEFRGNYYNREIKTFAKAGEDFFNDNRNYRPTKILNAQEVLLSTLETRNYVNKLSDYNGDVCDDSSYVLVVKEDTDEYSYHACLVCNKDGYDNTKEDKYCDKTWLDPTKVVYGIGTPETAYIYKGTTREELMNELELPISYIRVNNDGLPIAEKRGTKEGNRTLSPINIDVVDTNTLGTYKVKYKIDEDSEVFDSQGYAYYLGEEKTRNVVVYENEAPTISYKKENVVATDLAGNTTIERGAYTSGEWAQNVIATLNSKAYVNNTISTSKFQWNVDGKWQDFCDTDPCEKKITRELNQTVQFRLVDTNGHISLYTDPILLKIDNVKPTCTLNIPTPKASNDWYTQNVNIEFSEKIDQKTSSDNTIVSGVKKYNIQKSDVALVRNATTVTVTHSDDTNGITYKGYVEDEAGNFNTCNITFKKDTTAPTCTITKTNTGTTSGVTTAVACSDSGSGCDTNKNPTGESSLKENKTYTVYDTLGHTGTCTVTVTSQGQKRTRSCTAGKRCEGAGCETYKSCTNSACGVNQYKSCTHADCGCETYKRCSGAGCETYKSCANSACGVSTYKRCSAAGCETYKSCANSACGVSSYKTCKNSACGTETKTYSGTTPRCDDGCISMGGASDLGSGQFRWNCTCYKSCATSACGVSSYKSCRTSGCGCETYNRGSSCGAETYKSCRTSGCGCETYKRGSTCGCETNKTCRTGGCGVESYKSCRTSGCGCETYQASASKCGCSTWGDFGGWSNNASCSAGESTDHGTITECRTIYN